MMTFQYFVEKIYCVLHVAAAPVLKVRENPLAHGVLVRVTSYIM